MIQVRISLPTSVLPGESVEVKMLAAHPMESGFRLDYIGEVIPRDILQSVRVSYLGELVFAAEFGPGISANPFLSFYLKASTSGEVVFEWLEQDGTETKITRQLNVEAA